MENKKILDVTCGGRETVDRAPDELVEKLRHKGGNLLRDYTLDTTAANYIESAKRLLIECDAQLETNQHAIESLQAENASLKQQLAEANERLGAAVEDINYMKNFLMSGDECRFCKHQPRVEGVDSCLETCMFEYKGLQGKDEK